MTRREDIVGKGIFEVFPSVDFAHLVRLLASRRVSC